MMPIFLTSFLLVAASEMGDKTQLLAFALSAKFRKPGPIMMGILGATIFNHALAAWAGGWVSARVGPEIMKWILAAMFIGFAAWILVPDKDEGKEKHSAFGPFLTTLITFFFAEMGDKTQLATVALAARFQSVFWVTAGTTAGMLFSDGLAVLFGSAVAERIPMKWVRRAAAALFFIFGTAILVGF